jgi:hypothetical protein
MTFLPILENSLIISYKATINLAANKLISAVHASIEQSEYIRDHA